MDRNGERSAFTANALRDDLNDVGL